MKKHYSYTFMLYMLSGLMSLQAQVTLTRADLAYQAGDSHSYNTTDPMELVTNIDPTPAGPNKTWNFSSLNAAILPGSTSEYVDPATTPFASEVEDVNLAIKNEGGTDGPYQFVNVSDGGLEHRYIAWYEDGNTSMTTITPVLTAMQYPLSYGQTHSEDYVAEMIHMGSLFMLDSTSTSYEVDAWGTVTTPAGTFQDVLRIKRTNLSTGYMYYEGNWRYTSDLSSTDYSWFAAGIHTSLITISKFEGDDGYTVTWLTNPRQATGIEGSSEDLQVAVWPNPVSDMLHVKSPDPVDGYTLYDATGRCVLRAGGEQGQQFSFSTLALPSGTYILALQSETGIAKRKIIIRGQH